MVMPDFRSSVRRLAVALGALMAACTPGCNCLPRPTEADGTSRICQLVEGEPGPTGTVPVRAETVVSGLEVPWGIAFLPGGDWLVTERPGRLRLVRGGKLLPEPVMEVPGSGTSEGGLLGLVLHPDFGENHLFYVYRTASEEDAPVNRIERYRLSEDHRSAELDRVILDDIPAATYHNGGRMRWGPDGMLYVGTGDARDPDRSQDPKDPAGKILRITSEGAIPEDNPFGDAPGFIMGVRNTQGFDWRDDDTLLVSDHGPSGEMLRYGHDEVTVAERGDNLGWPSIYGCDRNRGMVSPSIVWEDAVPPGGAAIYRGDAIPQWKGDLMLASLGAKHLHRIRFDSRKPRVVTHHEVYFRGELGRLREAIMGPDRHLYLTTSRCDGRGECPPDRDAILRIVPGSD